MNEYIEKRKATYAKVKEEGPKKVIKDSGFKPGVKNIVQNPKTKRWDQEAVIVNQRSKRSYVLDDDGHRFTRNRRQLVLAPVPDDPEARQEMEVDVQSQQSALQSHSALQTHSALQNNRSHSQRPVRKKNKPKRLIES